MDIKNPKTKPVNITILNKALFVKKTKEIKAIKNKHKAVKNSFIFNPFY